MSESRIFPKPFMAGRRIGRPLAYVRLLRLPAIVTAFADVLAGSVVGTFPFGVAPSLSTVAWLLLASGCLYASGMALNDAFDVGEDQLVRPERPIPAGAVTVKSAVFLAAGLMLLGLIAAAASGSAVAFYIAVALACLVVLYDGYVKRLTYMGPLLLGLMRVLNFGIGAAAGSAFAFGSLPAHIFGPAVVLGAYTVVTSLVATQELNENYARVAARAALGFLIVIGGAMISMRYWTSPSASGLALFIAHLILVLLLAGLLLKCFVTAKARRAILRRRYGRPIRSLVGSALLGILALDASFVVVWWGDRAGLAHTWVLLALGLLMLAAMVPVSMLARRISIT